MSEYRCPVCADNDPNGYLSCQWAGCPDGRDRSGNTYYSEPEPSAFWGYVLLAICAVVLVATMLITIHLLSGYYCAARWEHSNFNTKHTWAGGCLVAKKGSTSYMPERRVRQH